MGESILFFDGVCTLCNRFVDLLLRIDRDRRFRYAPLQGETAQQMRERFEEFPEEVETFVLVRGDRLYLRSSAVFEVVRQLPYPYRAASWLAVLPRCLTDWAYGMVARHRNRFFGQRETCRLPGPDEQELLLR